MVAVACATDTAEEEVAVEEENGHSDESTLEMVLERGFVNVSYTHLTLPTILLV